MTRPSDLVFEAMKVEYNPVQKKYFVYAKVVNMFDKREDYHPADYDVFVFDEFNPDTVGATTKLYFCSIVYFDEFAGRPEISHMFLSKNISKIFTNAYEDSDMAIAVYTAMQKDFVNQQVLDKIEEDTDDEFEDGYDAYLEWPDNCDLKDDEEEEDGWLKDNNKLRSPVPNLSFTNLCYAISEDGNKLLFHIYTSSRGPNDRDVYSTIELEKVGDMPDEDVITIYWHKVDRSTLTNDIFPVKVPKEKEWISRSVANIYYYAGDAMEEMEDTEMHEDIVTGYIKNVNEVDGCYQISYISDITTHVDLIFADKVPSWMKPTKMLGMNKDKAQFDARTTGYEYFIALGESKESIMRIVSRTPLNRIFKNMFGTKYAAEAFYGEKYEHVKILYNLGKKEGDTE